MLAGGDEVVPGALGGGGGEDRGGDLQEAFGQHGGAQGGDHVAAQDDVVLDLGVAQIEVAVFEALGLVGLAAAVDLEGELVVAAAAEHLDPGGDDFDVAGGELGVLAVALPDDALHGDGGLFVEALDDGHHVLGLDHDLGGPVEIAQDEEGQVLAHFADVLHPADELHLLAHVIHAQLVTGVGAGLEHGYQLLFVSYFGKYTMGVQIFSGSRMGAAARRASRVGRIWAGTSSAAIRRCSPVVMSFRDTFPWAISSSPKNAV